MKQVLSGMILQVKILNSGFVSLTIPSTPHSRTWRFWSEIGIQPATWAVDEHLWETLSPPGRTSIESVGVSKCWKMWNIPKNGGKSPVALKSFGFFCKGVFSSSNWDIPYRYRWVISVGHLWVIDCQFGAIAAMAPWSPRSWATKLARGPARWTIWSTYKSL